MRQRRTQKAQKHLPLREIERGMGTDNDHRLIKCDEASVAFIHPNDEPSIGTVDLADAQIAVLQVMQ